MHPFRVSEPVVVVVMSDRISHPSDRGQLEEERPLRTSASFGEITAPVVLEQPRLFEKAERREEVEVATMVSCLLPPRDPRGFWKHTSHAREDAIRFVAQLLSQDVRDL